MKVEGLNPKEGDWGVSIAYVTPDLSCLGFSLPYQSSEEQQRMAVLTGNVLLGLVFGVVDPEANDPNEQIVMGARAFITTKQIDTWLAELLPAVRMYIADNSRAF